MSLSIREVIKNYREDNFYRVQRLNPLVRKFSRGLRGFALDLGAGSGINSKYLEARGFNVIALDANPEVIELAIENGVKAYLEDIRKLKWSKSNYYTIILCLYVLQHFNNYEIDFVINGIKRSLRGKGIAVISSFLSQENNLSADVLCSYFRNDTNFRVITKDTWKRLDVSHREPHYHEGFYIVVRKWG
jgi:2-polyprenyl-3-methyl-5-hydroxy-6-metoxy-1,4-benzoquinol methylase